ncbi:hypothetical protein [Streptomyces iconiensis]|uniref:Mce-associated membrane protein n=1 Tax=Streptomyces iconiensis TaxID=1384038 RepID=A0ABT7A8C2_9ACTN|nr:hypothetical protein [Streptomyces iconiensis]MDJ1137571.1 hypothetical protein [Streptomyces iconiensis]
MSTTRHLLNRRRRMAAQPGGAEETPAEKSATKTATAVRERDREAGRDRDRGPKSGREPGREPGHEPGRDRGPAPRTAATKPASTRTPSAKAGAEAAPVAERTARRGTPRRLLALCAVVTVACGAFAAWGANEAGALRDGAAARNTALADAGRTSEVKGEVTSAVNALFSYDHAGPAKNARAAERLLTGRAVKQHRALLAQVRAQGGKQRLVLTTTVTDSAVAALEGNRARVLLFADQHSARTGKSAQKESKSDKGTRGKGGKSSDKNAAADATYAGAMLSVDAVHEAGTWKIANIDTLN